MHDQDKSTETGEAGHSLFNSERVRGAKVVSAMVVAVVLSFPWISRAVTEF